MTVAVIYRWKLKPGQEEDFVHAWGRLTDVLREERGGLGSRLHKAGDGSWIAYALWPDRAAYEHALENPPKSAARALMAAAIAERFPETVMEVVEDRVG
jgi:quinol monooxygenase YgiN